MKNIVKLGGILLRKKSLCIFTYDPQTVSAHVGLFSCRPTMCFVLRCAMPFFFVFSFGLGPILHTCSELCYVVPKKKIQQFFFNFLRGHAKLSTYFFQVCVLFLGSIVCLVKFNIIKSPKLKFVSNNNKLIIIRVCNFAKLCQTNN